MSNLATKITLCVMLMLLSLNILAKSKQFNGIWFKEVYKGEITKLNIAVYDFENDAELAPIYSLAISTGLLANENISSVENYLTGSGLFLGVVSLIQAFDSKERDMYQVQIKLKDSGYVDIITPVTQVFELGDKVNFIKTNQGSTVNLDRGSYSESDWSMISNRFVRFNEENVTPVEFKSKCKKELDRKLKKRSKRYHSQVIGEHESGICSDKYPFMFNNKQLQWLYGLADN